MGCSSSSSSSSPYSPSSSSSFVDVTPDEERFRYCFPAYLCRAIDGDTVKLKFRSGYHNEGDYIVCENFRLRGIDAAEIHSEIPEVIAKAKAAKEYLEKRLAKKRISVRTEGREKYGRLLAVLSIKGKSINEEMLRNGLALPYDGKGKKPIHYS